MSVHVFTRARVIIRLKGQISENNRVAIAFEQGILEITEPDTVFIKDRKAQSYISEES